MGKDDESEKGDYRDRRMHFEIQQLADTVKKLQDAIVVENVLAQGFERLQAQLEPLGRLPAQFETLRDIAPPRQPVPPATAQLASDMLAAMRGVRLPGGSLGIQEVNVLFIGQAVECALPPPAALPLGACPAQSLKPAHQPVVSAPSQHALGGGIPS